MLFENRIIGDEVVELAAQSTQVLLLVKLEGRGELGKRAGPNVVEDLLQAARKHKLPDARESIHEQVVGRAEDLDEPGRVDREAERRVEKEPLQLGLVGGDEVEGRLVVWGDVELGSAFEY